MHEIQLKRVYEEPAPDDGIRILVERLWPRGLSKAKAQIDYWEKEVAPSHELRKWYGHEASKWTEFQRRYEEEIQLNADAFQRLADRVQQSDKVTFVFASRETKRNNSVALKAYIEARF